MLIGSKLPPEHASRTFFGSGRAAFSYLIGNVVRPRKVCLPAFTCWSLVSAMQRRFPGIPLEFYTVCRDLSCHYPCDMDPGDLIVFIHFFGYENTPPPRRPGCTILEDWSHSYLSQIMPTGDYVFGSYRKIMKVVDGGFINSFFNPIYEPGRNLDAWLRLQSQDWKDVREAENMIDREWRICDISSQSLAILLTANEDLVRQKRRRNELFLFHSIRHGTPLIEYREKECPLLHNRLFDSVEERDSLRAFLAENGVFTSIHWPTHPLVKKANCNIEDALWLEGHILSIPVSHDYGLNDMEFIANKIHAWGRAGA